MQDASSDWYPLWFADEGSRESVDAGCRNLTASWVREKAANDPLVDLCDYYEGLEKAGQDVRLIPHHILKTAAFAMYVDVIGMVDHLGQIS